MNMKKYFELGMLKLLEQKCIDEITVSELIEEVSSCKGTFYKHYVDKYDLCCSCIKNNVYIHISSEEATWDEFIMQCLTAFEKNSKVVLHAFESTDVNSVRRYHENFVTEYLTKIFVQNGGDITSVINKASLEMCGVSVTEIIFKWLYNGRKDSKDSVRQLLRAVMPQAIYQEIYAISA